MGHLKGFQDIKVGKLFNFSTWDTERSSSRIVNPRCYLIVNVTAILISLVTYFGMKYLVSGVDDNICRVDAKGCLSQMLTVRNLVALYVVNASSGYFYVIYLYLAFKNRRKYFTEAHKEMEDGRSFWGHIIWCSIRTSVALFIGIMNNIGVFYFYGIEDEFSPQFYDTYNTYGIFSIIGASTLGWMLFWKLVLFIIKFFIWEVWFDFGHYWTHRMGHYFKFLYYFGHSVHHESISPDAWDGMLYIRLLKISHALHCTCTVWRILRFFVFHVFVLFSIEKTPNFSTILFCFCYFLSIVT